MQFIKNNSFVCLLVGLLTFALAFAFCVTANSEEGGVSVKSISSAQSAIDAAKGKYRDELRPKLSANLAATLDHAFEKYKAVAFRIPSPQARTSSWNFETAKDNRLWIFGTVDSLAKRTQPVWWVVLDSGIAGGYAIFLSEENGEVLFVHSIPEG